MNTLCRYFTVLGIGLAAIMVSPTVADAQTQLAEPTTEQVDMALRRLGISRAQAEARAKLVGVDLNTYLIRAMQGIAPEPRGTRSPADTVSSADSAKNTLSPQVIKNIADILGPDSLPYFGYFVFTRIPPGFEPSADGPVDPEYLVGPDDVLRLSIWGQTEFQSEFTVDRDGRIFIPTVGQVLISGMTLEAASNQLKRQLARSYSGLDSKPPTVFFDLTVARMRPKRVFILGEVEGAGGYTVHSYANVFRALFSVGGPTVKGSLRDIRVIRNNKLVARVDLYDYLTGANTVNDVRLQNNDIIYVPPRGKTVRIIGEISKARIFELKEGEGMASLVKFAGGLLSTAFYERAQVERIIPPAQRVEGKDHRLVVDFNLKMALAQSKPEFALQDGDAVSIFRILDELNNFVTVEGAVWRPGRYQLEEATSLAKLVASAGGARPDAFKKKAHLFRLNADRTTRSLIEVDLEKLADRSTGDFALVGRDSLIVFGLETVDILFRYVHIEGEVRSSGQYALADSMKVSDLILLSGGFTQSADIHYAEVARVDLNGYYGDTLTVVFKTPQSDITIGHPLRGRIALDDTLTLRHQDIVFVRPNPNYQPQRVVTVAGEVRYPGKFALRERRVRLTKVLEWAGGPTRDGYIGGGRLFRGGARVNINFEDAVEDKEGEIDIIMQDGDSLFVPFKPNAVRVSGEVFNPGLQSYVGTGNLWDYVDNAGGLTDSAQQVYLTRPDGSTELFRTGWFTRIFQSNPRLQDGSSIFVSRKIPEPESEKIDYAGTFKDTFAILASALTIIVLVSQTK